MPNCSDEQHWKEEAKMVIEDVKEHVRDISTSLLPSTDNKIFLNLTTLEMKDFCVELTSEGFTVVGEKHDCDDKRGKYPVFETPYSLLDSLSPAYRSSFGAQLIMKLNQLKDGTNNNDETE